jgi:RHS repeat-associated core domain
VTDPTGLTHLGAREYDPIAGRFISVDPVLTPGDPQQLNGYAYADNNPTTFTDPTGEQCNNGPDGQSCYDPNRGTHTPMGGKSGSDETNGHSGSGSHPGSGHGDSTDEERAQAAGVSVSDLHRAEAIKKKSVTDVIVHAGGELLSEFLGINDIKGCFTRGEIGSCASLVANAIPWYKLGKALGLIKVLHRAYDAFKRFLKESKWADRILSCNSFTPATAVLMADGSHKPIKELRPGDKVLATNPATGKTVARTVVATIAGTGIKHLVTVTVDTDGKSGDQTGSVTATDGHPFFVATAHPAAGPNLANGTWTPARDLQPGDLLRTPIGTLLPVLSVATTTATQTAYNLTVDTDHTYNVIAGDMSVLVHNCDNPWMDPRGERHVRDTHYAGGPKNVPGKSTFDEDVDPYDLVDDSVNFPARRQTGTTRCERVCTAPNIIGVDQSGLPTRVYTVVTEQNGRVVTMHPGVPN